MAGESKTRSGPIGEFIKGKAECIAGRYEDAKHVDSADWKAIAAAMADDAEQIIETIGGVDDGDLS